MIYPAKQFWAMSNSKTESGKHIHLDIYKFSLSLKKPKSGVGSDGGGYILICENCQKPLYVNSKHRKFCSKKCQYKFYQDQKLINMPTPTGNQDPRVGRIHKNCECCNKTFIAKAHDIYRGHFLYDSAKCASKFKSSGIRSLWFICNNCNTPFKAIRTTNAIYCSHECRDDHMKAVGAEIFFTTTLQLKNKSDLAQHNLNQQILQTMNT